jgi:hypothetical protein
LQKEKKIRIEADRRKEDDDTNTYQEESIRAMYIVKLGAKEVKHCGESGSSYRRCGTPDRISAALTSLRKSKWSLMDKCMVKC